MNVRIKKKRHQMMFMEVGGSMAQLWKNYYSDAGVILVGCLLP